VNIGRCSGILLHITSLPGKFGIGDLGPESRWFADALASAGQKLWCILPLGPTGEENSPYQSRSAFAGNPLLVSPEELVSAGYLSPRDLAKVPRSNNSSVDFPKVRRWKEAILRKAFQGFSEDHSFRQFERDNAAWLDAFAEFMALRDANGGISWTRFNPAINAPPESVRFHRFVQYEFDRQWRALRDHCDRRQILLMGDMPFYVEHDSSDVWSHPDCFDLDLHGEARSVGGVPPDYFSKTGQLWGTPTYRWDKLEESGFRWWVDRLRFALQRTALLRLDHFRGFESYWSVPADQPTARNGRWIPGPRAKLFHALQDAFGPLPFVAENLGVITSEVEDLRRQFHLPGMAVLQFGFDDDLRHRPCHYSPETVAFTGTHDNDTTRGWWENNLQAARRGGDRAARCRVANIQAYLQTTTNPDRHWSFIQAVHASAANVSIVPMQDVLGLGSEARINIPGSHSGNWRWRLDKKQLRPQLWRRLRDLTSAADRDSAASPQPAPRTRAATTLAQST
jgi:4-alpha-glucanotransferase